MRKNLSLTIIVAVMFFVAGRQIGFSESSQELYNKLADRFDRTAGAAKTGPVPAAIDLADQGMIENTDLPEDGETIAPVIPVIPPSPPSDTPQPIKPKEMVRDSIKMWTGIGLGVGALLGAAGGIGAGYLLAGALPVWGAALCGVGIGLGIALGITALGYLVGSIAGILKVGETLFPE